MVLMIIEAISSTNIKEIPTMAERLSSSIIFVKTHKTASSTVAALLKTNALLIWNASSFVPKPGRGGFKWDFEDPRLRALSRLQLSDVTGSAPYKIWSSHVVYHPFLHVLVPGDPLLLTILRDPVKRLESAWLYYSQLGMLRQSTPITALLNVSVEGISEWRLAFEPNLSVLPLLLV